MRELHTWLQTYLPRTDFQRIVADHDGFGVGRDRMLAELPSGARSEAEFYFYTLRLLAEHGVLDDPELFVALANARPKRAAEVRTLAVQHGVDRETAARRIVGRRTAATLAAPGERWSYLLAVLTAINLAVLAALLVVVGDAFGVNASPDPLALSPEDPIVGAVALTSRLADAPRPSRSAPKRVVKPKKPPRPDLTTTPVTTTLPAPTRAARCEAEVAPTLHKMVPKFERQRARIDAPREDYRVHLAIAASGEITSVQSDKVWGLLNRDIVGTIENTTFPGAEYRDQCVCRIDLAGQRVQCREHGARSPRDLQGRPLLIRGVPARP